MQTAPSDAGSVGHTVVVGVCGVPAVTSWGYRSPFVVFSAETYLSDICRAGGTPVILPPVNPSTARVTDALRALDPVVLAGGTDVATGGALHQHLLDHGYAGYRTSPGRLNQVTEHAVRAYPTSLLGACSLGELQGVNSHHHQGLALLGDEGCVIPYSFLDGALQAVDWPAHRFVLGVQWDPGDSPMDGLSAGFVAAARAAAEDRASPMLA